MYSDRQYLMAHALDKHVKGLEVARAARGSEPTVYELREPVETDWAARERLRRRETKKMISRRKNKTSAGIDESFSDMPSSLRGRRSTAGLHKDLPAAEAAQSLPDAANAPIVYAGPQQIGQLPAQPIVSLSPAAVEAPAREMESGVVSEALLEGEREDGEVSSEDELGGRESDPLMMAIEPTEAGSPKQVIDHSSALVSPAHEASTVFQHLGPNPEEDSAATPCQDESPSLMDLSGQTAELEAGWDAELGHQLGLLEGEPFPLDTAEGGVAASEASVLEAADKVVPDGTVAGNAFAAAVAKLRAATLDPPALISAPGTPVLIAVPPRNGEGGITGPEAVALLEDQQLQCALTHTPESGRGKHLLTSTGACQESRGGAVKKVCKVNLLSLPRKAIGYCLAGRAVSASTPSRVMRGHARSGLSTLRPMTLRLSPKGQTLTRVAAMISTTFPVRRSTAELVKQGKLARRPLQRRPLLSADKRAAKAAELARRAAAGHGDGVLLAELFSQPAGPPPCQGTNSEEPPVASETNSEVRSEKRLGQTEDAIDARSRAEVMQFAADGRDPFTSTPLPSSARNGLTAGYGLLAGYSRSTGTYIGQVRGSVEPYSLQIPRYRLFLHPSLPEQEESTHQPQTSGSSEGMSSATSTARVEFRMEQVRGFVDDILACRAPWELPRIIELLRGSYPGILEEELRTRVATVLVAVQRTPALHASNLQRLLKKGKITLNLCQNSRMPYCVATNDTLEEWPRLNMTSLTMMA